MRNPTEIDLTSDNPWDWGIGPNARIAASSLFKGSLHAAICCGWLFIYLMKKVQALIERA